MPGLTRPVINQITAPGQEGETDVVVRDERLAVETPSESSISEIEFGYYDPIQGVLTLQTYNGERFNINGFPTADTIPMGITGPVGESGVAGKPGKAGRDGEKGEPGCVGLPGDRGQQGPGGPDGRTGIQGPPGMRGIEGPVGPLGNQGPRGVQGAPGATGPTGEPGPDGAAGAPGTGGTANIIVSSADPGAVGGGVLWVNTGATAPVVVDPIPPPLVDPPIGTPWP